MNFGGRWEHSGADLSEYRRCSRNHGGTMLRPQRSRQPSAYRPKCTSPAFGESAKREDLPLRAWRASSTAQSGWASAFLDGRQAPPMGAARGRRRREPPARTASEGRQRTLPARGPRRRWQSSLAEFAGSARWQRSLADKAGGGSGGKSWQISPAEPPRGSTLGAGSARVPPQSAPPETLPNAAATGPAASHCTPPSYSIIFAVSHPSSDRLYKI